MIHVFSLQGAKAAPFSPLPNVDFLTAVTVVCQNGMGALLDDWFFEELQQDLRNRVAPKFWSFFKGTHTQHSTLFKYEELQLARYFNSLHSAKMTKL